MSRTMLSGTLAVGICCATFGAWAETSTTGAATAASDDDVTSVLHSIIVSNPSPDDWVEIPVEINWSELHEAPAGLTDNKGQTVYVQRDDLDGNGLVDAIVFLASLKAGESVEFFKAEGVVAAPVSRAHAGMYMKSPEMKGFEGPGWESDVTAFRIYWDERNATDVFNKTTPTLSLANLAKKGVNYHKLTPWGMDTLKVKTAVGIGGFGAFVNGKVEKAAKADRTFVVRADGPVRAVADLMYSNWEAGDRKLEMRARMRISAGQDYADCDLETTATDGKRLPELVCGFVKHTSDTTLIKDPKVAMVGRWGNQALGEGEKVMGGNMGLAVMARNDVVAGIGEDDVNHYIRLKQPQRVSYRYLVDWYREPLAAGSAEEFEALMRRTAARQPKTTVSFSAKKLN